MEQKIIAGIIIFILILILSIFVFFKTSDIEVNPIISKTIDHEVSFEDMTEVKNTLFASENTIITIRIPGTLSWNKGETGSFILGLKNKYSEEKTLFLSVIPDPPREQETTSWIVYPGKKTFSPGGVELIPIIANPVNPEIGSYLYRIVVCETQECQNLNSPSIYATTTFSFKIV